MSNPDDYWRHRGPAPHDRTHDQTLEEQRQGKQSQPANIGDGDGFAGPVGTPSAAGGALAFAIVVLIFAAPIFGCLYPLAAGSALLAGLLTNGMLSLVAPALGDDGRLPFAIMAGAVAFWVSSRFDHRLADQSAIYRQVRHIVRLFLIAFFITVNTINQQTGGSMPRNVQQFQAIISDSRFVIVMGFAMVGAHFLLLKTKRFREFWHWGLQIVKLRPS